MLTDCISLNHKLHHQFLQTHSNQKWLNYGRRTTYFKLIPTAIAFSSNEEVDSFFFSMICLTYVRVTIYYATLQSTAGAWGYLTETSPPLTPKIYKCQKFTHRGVISFAISSTACWNWGKLLRGIVLLLSYHPVFAIEQTQQWEALHSAADAAIFETLSTFQPTSAFKTNHCYNVIFTWCL